MDNFKEIIFLIKEIECIQSMNLKDSNSKPLFCEKTFETHKLFLEMVKKYGLHEKITLSDG